MRDAFAHEAMLMMPVDGDVRAPGAAITVELCGSWEHEPPCPVAPHHSQTERLGDEVRLRVLFATESGHEADVRARIDEALAKGQLLGADGEVTVWQMTRSGPSLVETNEIQHARRLVNTPGARLD
ncbi:MAG: hypothetical protein ABI775_13210 [Pseudonocardiales bacterium]